MTMMKVLSLLLAATPALANLRGSEMARQERNLQVLDLESDQIGMIVVYDMVMSSTGADRSGLDEDYAALRAATDSWIFNAMAPLDAANTTWSLEECVGTTLRGAWRPRTREHNVVVRYICEFDDLDDGHSAPYDVWWTNLVETTTATPINQAALLADVVATDSIYQDIISISSSNFQSVGTSGRSRFEEAYVLPYYITWSFTTHLDLIKQVDIDGTRNATIEWINENWEALYGEGTAFKTTFERLNTQVRVRYSSFSPRVTMYQQSVSLAVELLVGANNITDVPSVVEYGTAMQLYYPIVNFTNTLAGLIPPPPEAVLRNSTQTTFAFTPTFEVSTLSESVSRIDPEEMPLIVTPSLASISVNLDPASATP